MKTRSLALVLLGLVGLAGCNAPAPDRLPGQVDGLGTGTADCVAACRAFFSTCSAVTVFVDGNGLGLTPAECATTCADEGEYDAALEAAGCGASWAAYETCVLSHVDSTDCSVDDCSIEWGVYRGCTGP